MIDELKTSIGNLDPDTWRIQPRDQQQALNVIFAGLTQIEKDGFADQARLRPRDLHYAGYYPEIQFARLMKETKLFSNRNSGDPREVAVSSSIFDADDMAHKFHFMRGVTDKNVLPASVVGSGGLIAGRLLSELMRQVRHDLQMPAERLAEREVAAAETARQQYREAVRGLAQQYARMTADPEAASLVYDYVQRQQPPLDRETIDAMRQALEVAGAAGGDYLAQPEAVQRCCLEMCRRSTTSRTIAGSLTFSMPRSGTVVCPKSALAKRRARKALRPRSHPMGRSQCGRRVQKKRIFIWRHCSADTKRI
jgi:hypothetical protein